MDNNLGNTQPVINPVPAQPQVSSAKPKVGRVLLMIISAVLTIVVLVGIGYMLFLNYTNNKTTHSAQVYNQPTITTPTVTPQQTNYQINPKDTSNQAINQDNQAVDQELNNANSDLNNVDQSLNDQQTNLQ